MRQPVPAIFALFAALSLAHAARADLPPPDGYVEECTVEKKQQPGTTCTTCDGYGPEPDKCKQKLAGTSYQYVCKTWGATVYTEVWCDGAPKPPEEQNPPKDTSGDDDSGGCSLGGGGAGSKAGGVLAVGLVAGALAVFLRRRRRGG